jgi:uncharacterized Tic20 family protein
VLATVKEKIVQAEEQNYGVATEHSANQVVMSAQEEKTWSSLTHLSIFLNLVTGFLGPVVALVIWLVYRDRSPKVAFHALQSMWYQVAWFVLLAAGWAFTGLFLLVPVMALLTIVPFVHATYAAYRVGQGTEYRYPFVADLIEDR